MYNVKVFNSDHYKSYEEADESGAVYTTPSTIDCIDLNDGLLSSRIGLFDLIEVIEVIKKCLGNDSLIIGILHETKGFIELDKLLE